MKLNRVYLFLLLSLVQLSAAGKPYKKSRTLKMTAARRFVRDLRYAPPPKRIGNFEIGEIDLKSRSLIKKGITEHELLKTEEKKLHEAKMKQKAAFSRVPRYLKGKNNRKIKKNRKTKRASSKKRRRLDLSPGDKAKLAVLKAQRDIINAQIAQTVQQNQSKNVEQVYQALGVDCPNDQKYALLGVGALSAGALAGNYRKHRLRKKHRDYYSKIMLGEMMLGQMNKEVNDLKEVLDGMTKAGSKASRVEYDLTFLIQRKIGNLATS